MSDMAANEIHVLPKVGLLENPVHASHGKRLVVRARANQDDVEIRIQHELVVSNLLGRMNPPAATCRNHTNRGPAKILDWTLAWSAPLDKGVNPVGVFAMHGRQIESCRASHTSIENECNTPRDRDDSNQSQHLRSLVPTTPINAASPLQIRASI